MQRVYYDFDMQDDPFAIADAARHYAEINHIQQANWTYETLKAHLEKETTK